MKKILSLMLVLAICTISMISALAAAPYDELAANTYGMKINVAEDAAGIITVTYTAVGQISGLSSYAGFINFDDTKVSLLEYNSTTEKYDTPVSASVTNANISGMAGLMKYVDFVAMKSAGNVADFSKNTSTITLATTGTQPRSSFLWNTTNGNSATFVSVNANTDYTYAKLYFKRKASVTGDLDASFITHNLATGTNTRYSCTQDAAMDLKNDTARFYLTWTPYEAEDEDIGFDPSDVDTTVLGATQDKNVTALDSGDGTNTHGKIYTFKGKVFDLTSTVDCGIEVTTPGNKVISFSALKTIGVEVPQTVANKMKYGTFAVVLENFDLVKVSGDYKIRAFYDDDDSGSVVRGYLGGGTGDVTTITK